MAYSFLSSSHPSFFIVWRVAKVVYVYLCCNYTATSACIAYLPIEELINLKLSVKFHRKYTLLIILINHWNISHVHIVALKYLNSFHDRKSLISLSCVALQKSKKGINYKNMTMQRTEGQNRTHKGFSLDVMKRPV